MKRRRLLIVLALVVPLAIFVVAKTTASWRPVAMGPLENNNRSYLVPDVRVSERAVVAGAAKNWESFYTRFDLQTGARVPLKNEGLATDGALLWQMFSSDRHTLKLREHGGPAITYRTSEAPPRPFTNATVVSPDYLRASADRIEMIYAGSYYRWNKASRKLESRVYLRQPDASDSLDVAARNDRIALGERWALTRDGKTAVRLYPHVLMWRATRNGNLVRRVPLQGIAPADRIHLSAFGSYVLHTKELGRTGRVLDAETGRELWRFRMFKGDSIILSPDEKSLAILRMDSSRAEVHDPRTGALSHTLALVPGVTDAAFSPDNQTLYSLANGVLYRQRAR